MRVIRRQPGLVRPVLLIEPAQIAKAIAEA
jgi:hypothetical protein